MARNEADRSRFERYLEQLGEAVGHADRRGPLGAYLTGLLLHGERKSVEPMAATIDWRIERDFQYLKDELGLEHYEGRGWRGFHHHGVLCMAAYCFLAAERGRLPPLKLLPSSSPLRYPRVSAHGALPVRCERHNPLSFHTQRLIYARELLAALPCCPAWGANGTRKHTFVAQ